MYDLWIVGDNFTASYYRQYFKNNDFKSYVKTNFDAIPVCNSRFASNNTNMISRIQNSVASALNKCKRIPAYVVVVLDCDLPDCLNVKSNLCELIRPWLEWLISQFNSMFQDRKNNMPKKLIRVDDPFSTGRYVHCTLIWRQSCMTPGKGSICVLNLLLKCNLICIPYNLNLGQTLAVI